MSEAKIVVQYDSNLEPVQEFESIRCAAKTLHLNMGNISNCCHGKTKKTGGYYFRFKKTEWVINKEKELKEMFEVITDSEISDHIFNVIFMNCNLSNKDKWTMGRYKEELLKRLKK